MATWGNGEVLEFLELYRNEQIIWDQKHPLHRNRREVHEAWLRIQSSLSINCSIVDLKKKKESLMTSYRMHTNKKRKVDDYQTSWFAFSTMDSFLSGNYDNCNTNSTNDLEDEFFNNSTTYNESTPTAPIYTGCNTTNEKINILPIKKIRPIQGKPIDIKIINDEVKGAEYHLSKRQIDEGYTKSSDFEKAYLDEYDLYGQLLAKKLRKLDEHQRDIAMHEIDNIMFRSKMKSTGQAMPILPNQPLQQLRGSSSPSSQLKVKSPVFVVAQETTHYDDEVIQYQQDPMQSHHSDQ